MIIINFNQIYNNINDYLDLKQDDYVVIGVSGGPDSMALLHLLLKLREIKKFNIICAHVHHNVRKESDEELIFVKNYCENNNVIFEHMKIEEKINGNFENEARKIRYNFFNKLIDKYHAKYLFTAHHGDDLMETILMKIVRGSNINGYSGFQEITDLGDYKLVRPLISVTKDQIIEYNKANNLDWVVDHTNMEDIHTRNRYRKYILPKLKEEDNNVNLKFLQYSKILNECNTYIEKEVKNKLNNIYIDKKLNISMFIKEDKFIQKNILYYILKDYYGSNIECLSNKHIDMIINMLQENKNSKISLPLNVIGIKSYNYFYLEQNKKEENYKIILENITILPNGHKIEIIEKTEENSNYICKLNTKDITLPLYVRNRKVGDVIEVMNLNGHKKIKDIFISEKIDIEKRDSWPILVDSKDNILWLPGIKKSKYNKQKDEKCDIILKYY